MVAANEVVVPNPEFLDGSTPVVVLGGVSWPVPPLAPKQNRKVVPALMRAAPRVMAMAALQKEGTTVEVMTAVMSQLDEATYDCLLDAVYWGLKRAHPNLTRDQFDDMAVGTTELAGAVPVLSVQAGLAVKEVGAVLGEDKAGKR